MCIYSQEVELFRNATSKESLRLRGAPEGVRGLYPANRDHPQPDHMVCILPGSHKAVIKEVQFDPHQMNMSAQAQSWQGKKDVEVELLQSRTNTYTIVRFPDGYSVYLHFCQIGMRLDIGIPALTGKEGVAAVESAIKEATSVPTLDKATPFRNWTKRLFDA